MKRRSVFLVISVTVLFLVFSGLTSEVEKIPSVAPVNEEFLKFQEEPSLVLASLYTDDGHPLGLLPSPHDITHLKSQPIMSLANLFEIQAKKTEDFYRGKSTNYPRISLESFPSSYDLRTQNKVTSVKDQANCGSCWAFASYGSLESYLLPSENWDFSEQSLIDEHGFDYGPCDGGQIYMSIAYLSRWSGPVKEEDDPYVYSSSELTVKKHVQEVNFILPRSDYLDNDAIKEAIMNYGAVYTAMYYESRFYNSTNRAYYNTGIRDGSHAVTIVGWDDDFDKNKFNALPPGNGAFIVKNSWGADWGEGGYFYVSYYDEFFAIEDVSAVVKAETPSDYEVVYQYDPLGWVSSLGYGTETAWFANIFNATSNIPLTAIGFYSASTLTSYEIFIYTDVNDGQPRSGTLVSTKTGSLNSSGYFTIPLDNAVPLLVNQKFSVAFRLSTDNFEYPIPFEKPIQNYSSKATANAGESFVSYDGDTWNDLHTSWNGKFENANVCLKAYARNATSSDGYPALYPPSNFELERLENNFIFFKEYINRLSWQANSQNETTMTKYRIYRKVKVAADETFQLICEVSSSVFTYDDRGLKKSDLYSYWLTAVDEYGRESEPATASN